MKCRDCSKNIRKTKLDRNGLCKVCYDYDKKWVKESMRFLDAQRKRRA